MNLRQLESLIWVARLRSFGAAAAKLNTTQPGISIRIQELEKELGLTLFDRSQRLASLTSEGRECLAYAEQIITWTAELQMWSASRDEVRGRVSLGVSEFIAYTWLSDLFSLLSENHPELKIDTTIDMTPRLLHGLEASDYDVVLAGAHSFSTTYPTLDLGNSQFVWLAAPEQLKNKPEQVKGKRKVAEQPLTPRDLQSRRIITYAKDAAIHQSIDDWFVAHGAYPMHRITCNTATAMATLAAAGLGVTLLPRELATRELADGRLVVIPTRPDFAPVHYRAIYAPGRRGVLGRIVAEAARTVSLRGKSGDPPQGTVPD